MTQELLKALFLFGVVLVLIWWTSRIVGHRALAIGRGRLLRVMEQVQVGKDRSVMLVESAGRFYLLGCTPQQISLLDGVTDPEALAQIQMHLTSEAEKAGNTSRSFGNLLTRLKGPMQGDGAFAPVTMSIQKSGVPPAFPGASELWPQLREQIQRLKSWKEP